MKSSLLVFYRLVVLTDRSFPKSDVFIGPGCEYAVAPVARYAGAWQIPVITAAAQADAFYHKEAFPTLTRMMGSYTMVGQAMQQILQVEPAEVGTIPMDRSIDTCI
jgi:hypothetical protein